MKLTTRHLDSQIDSKTKIRIARPSRDLQAAEQFYTAGLGLGVLYRSQGDEFAALLMLGLPGAPWHLELTQAHHHVVIPAPTAEDLLVLYLGERPSEASIRQLETQGGQRVAALNPYWDRHGVTIADPDGYRLVLCQREWTA